MAAQPGMCRTWSETPKTGFLTTRLIGDLVHKEKSAVNAPLFKGAPIYLCDRKCALVVVSYCAVGFQIFPKIETRSDEITCTTSSLIEQF